MARAKSVLPVPGGPTNKAPLGILPPNRENFCGLRKNSTISSSSSLASSIPATSSNVTRPCFSVSNLARDLPNPIAPPLPPPCIRFIKNIQMPISTRNGNQSEIIEKIPDCCCGSALIATPCAKSVGVTSTPSGLIVRYEAPSLPTTITRSPSSVTEATSPLLTRSTKSEYGSDREDTVVCPPLNRLNSARISRNNTTQKAILRTLPKRTLPKHKTTWVLLLDTR